MRTNRDAHSRLTADDAELLRRAAAFGERPDVADLSADALRSIADRHGIELASAVLYDRLLRSPRHGPTVDRIEGRRTSMGGTGTYSCPWPMEPRQSDWTRDPRARATPLPERQLSRGTNTSRCHPPPLVAVVPGAFWRHHDHTGADGQRVLDAAARLGLRGERIPVPSFGPLRVNAETIMSWLAARRDDGPIVLASLSKGGADLKTALALSAERGSLADDFPHVSVWVNLSGMVSGTPLVRWLRDRPLRHWGVRLLLAARGMRFATVDEIRRDSDGPLAAWPPLPPGLRVIHVVGVPLRRHLSHRWAPKAYDRLAPLGPNDGGGILLGDLTGWPGAVYPVWGVDHYLNPPGDDGSLLRAVLAEAAEHAATPS